MQVVLGHEDVLAPWIERRIESAPGRLGPCQTIGFAIDDELIAAAAYRHFRELPHGNDIEIAFAAISPRWCTRGNLAVIFEYPFRQLNCARLTAIVQQSNKRSRRLIAGECSSGKGKSAGLGFKREGVIRKGWDGRENAIVYGMTRQEAQRWLEKDMKDELRQGWRRQRSRAA